MSHRVSETSTQLNSACTSLELLKPMFGVLCSVLSVFGLYLYFIKNQNYPRDIMYILKIILHCFWDRINNTRESRTE